MLTPHAQDGEAEIGQLDVAVLVDEHVVRLQVAVHHAEVAMQVLERE